MTQPREEDLTETVYAVRYRLPSGRVKIVQADNEHRPFTLASAQDQARKLRSLKDDLRFRPMDIEVMVARMTPWRAMTSMDSVVKVGDYVRHTGGLMLSGVAEVTKVNPETLRATIKFAGGYTTSVAIKHLRIAHLNASTPLLPEEDR